MISKDLLIHDCILMEKKGANREGEPIVQGYKIERVRFDFTQKTVMQDGIATHQDSVTLFIDPRQSVLYGYIPQELDSVIFQEKQYTIRAVKPCYTAGSNAVHHWELELV